MSNADTYDIVIVGGGLAGLTSAIALSGAGKKVLLLEKKTYPYHKVCGEYVSNEVLGYLIKLGFDPLHYGASKITKLRLSTPSGKNIYTQLDLGAFGLSRYTMDSELAKIAVKKGTELLTDTRVTDIQFEEDRFNISTQNGYSFQSKFVIGSWGKREMLDKKLERKFMNAHTGYIAVKHHILTDYPDNEIGLDNFKNGYSGISKIEGNKYNFCYFYKRETGSNALNPKEYLEEVVFKNTTIKTILSNADYLFSTPITINEISFEAKPCVENHILMCGDTAGLITPLCGNGMAMAITSAKILTDILLNSGLLEQNEITALQRKTLEQQYQLLWRNAFRQRLFWGRNIQALFGNTLLTEISMRLIHCLPSLERTLIKATHGKPI